MNISNTNRVLGIRTMQIVMLGIKNEVMSESLHVLTVPLTT